MLRVLVAGLIFFSSSAFAGIYGIPSCGYPIACAVESGENYGSLSAVMSAINSACLSEYGDVCTLIDIDVGTGTCTTVSGWDQRYRINYDRPNGLTDGGQVACRIGSRTDEDCPGEQTLGTDDNGYAACVDPPPGCEPGGDLGFTFSKQVDPSTAGDLCMTGYGGGCLATKTGGVCAGTSWCSTGYKLTDQACTGGEGTDGAPVGPTEVEKCVTEGGVRTCAKPVNDEIVASVDGNTVDLDAITPEGCFSFGSGGVVCGDSATAPPAPDDGVTPGTVATATGAVSNSAGDTVNYYNSTVVNNSGGPVETEGAPQPESSGSGDGSGEGLGECEGSECDGALPGDNEEVAGFGDLTSDFLDRVEAAPLIAAITGLGGTAPAASCEGESSDALAALGGEVLTFDAHCTMWPEISGVLYAVMMVAWSILGAIIILKA